MRLTSVFCAGEVLPLPKKYPRARQVSGHDFSRAVNDAPNLCPPERLRGIPRSGRPRGSRRTPTMRAAPCRIREFSRELIFLPLQQKSAADLANQFLTEFFQQDSNVQPACIRAEKYPHGDKYLPKQRVWGENSLEQSKRRRRELSEKLPR